MSPFSKSERFCLSVLSSQFSVLSSRRSDSAGTALIETAIVLPLYMMILLGVIYFGYATITKQRQTVAAACAAWLPGEQHEETLKDEFWRVSGIMAQDTTLEASEDIRDDDPYYGNLIQPQLVAGMGSLDVGGRGNDTFDRERVVVGLWNLALGEMHRRLEWVPGAGVVEQISRTFDDYAAYLNDASASGTGWIVAHPQQVSSPTIHGDGGEPYEAYIAEVLNGFGSDHWINRNQVALEAEYTPSFFDLKTILRNPADEPTDFATYVSGDYPELEERPVVSMTFDLTRRGDGYRYAVGEGGVTSEALVGQAGDLVRINLPPADEMNERIEGILGPNAWVAQ